MQLTLFSFIYLLTAVITFLAGLMAWQRRALVGARELASLSVSAAVCAFFLTFEAAATTVEGKVFWSQLSYIGGVFIPVFYFLFALRFTSMTRLWDIKAAWFLFVFPFISLGMAFTNGSHHLLWSGFSPINPETNMIIYYHGFWFWVGYAMYNYVLLLLATFLLVRFNVKNKNNAHYRQQSLYILLAGLLPWVASILYLVRLSPIQGLELTTISTAVSASFFVWALLKGRLLNLVPVARETLMETLPIGVVALDNRERLQDINQQARNYLELYQEDLLGLTLEQAMSAAKTPCCEGAEAIVKALLLKEGPNPQMVTVNNGATTYSIERQPIASVKGSRLLMIQDITKEVRQQEELQVARLKAEESDRLKSAFLANMSHEIRTPMNSIIGFISLLQEDNLSDAEKTEYLDIVRSNGDRLLSTLNDIVDISKIESGQAVVNQSAFDMNEVLLNCYGLFRQDAYIKQLEFQRPALLMPDVSYIRSDKEKIYSIVTNLVKNALKYTTKGFVKFDCSINDGELFFTVVDSGIGIPMEKQRAIFDRFVQVDSQRKSTYEGAGLGLAITKAFVELLGGDIAVESEEGKGSTFYVRIPVEPATPMMAGNG